MLVGIPAQNTARDAPDPPEIETQTNIHNATEKLQKTMSREHLGLLESVVAKMTRSSDAKKLAPQGLS